MVLGPGTRLGSYEIVEALGAGGMGEVYQARDTKLNRDVALKVLPDVFSRDPDRRARFQREAQVLAALNHPNIAQIYGLEEGGGVCALVMELVNGRDLSAVIDGARGLPLDAARGRQTPGAIPGSKDPGLHLQDALAIARQLADALGAAHDAGIIHRDLKPANIKVRDDGTVKVLDFGLAKALDPSGGRTGVGSAPDDLANSPTLTAQTQFGVILGTAAYMAPEQARGQAVDTRADIWAFGAVLYEMLSGRRLFQGETVSDVIAVVLTAPIDWAALPRATPPSVRRLLRRCLERDLKRRLRDIADARLDLDDADDVGSPAPPVTTAGRRAWSLWIAAGGGLLAGAALIWLIGGAPRIAGGAGGVTRWTMAMADPRYGGTGVALSRDGTLLAYAEWSGGQSHIMLRRIDQLDAKPIAGTDGGVRPFFSPDGHWVAYFQTSPWQLRKAPVTGGTSIALCDANFLGGSWGDDDNIVFSSAGSDRGGLMRVPATGGTAEPLTSPDASKDETSHQWPQVLPGGHAVLFTIDTKAAGLDTRRIGLLDLKTRTYRVLLSGGSEARYVPTGHLVYVRGGTLYAVPFDLTKLAVTGPETSVQTDVYYNPERGFADYSFADSGLLVYMSETRIAGRSRVEVVDRDGTTRPTSLPDQPYSAISLAPNGSSAALAIRNAQSGNSDIWRLDLIRDALTRLTSEGNNNDPLWSPDGRRIVFRSRRDADGIYWIDADGGTPHLIRSTEVREVPTSWSPNGQTLLFVSARQGIGQAFTLSMAQAHADAVPFFASSSDVTAPAYSPDGKWVAYASDESGRYEVYVRSAQGTGAIAVSADGGESPRWSRGGRELLYRDLAQNEIMSVDVETAPVFRASRPKPVLALRAAVWDVTRDGARFVVVRSSDPASSGARLEAITGWFDELRRRVK